MASVERHSRSMASLRMCWTVAQRLGSGQGDNKKEEKKELGC